MEIVSAIDKIDKSEWESFVQNHPDGTVFHTPEYFESFQEDKSAQAIFFALLDNNVIKGISIVLLLRESAAVKGYFSRRGICMAAPIVDGNDNAYLSFLLREQNKVLSTKLIYCEIRNAGASLNNIYGLNHYRIQPHLNILLDLKIPVSELYSGISASARNKINKANNLELEFKSLPLDRKNIQEVYALINKVYQRIHLPIVSALSFEKAIETLSLSDRVCLFGVYQKDILVSTTVLLKYKGQIYSWYLAGSKGLKGVPATEFLIWNVLCYSQSEGLTLYNWGGAGAPHVPYTVRDFKKKFGGSIVTDNRYLCVYSPCVYYFSSLSFKIYSAFLHLIKTVV